MLSVELSVAQLPMRYPCSTTTFLATVNTRTSRVIVGVQVGNLGGSSQRLSVDWRAAQLEDVDVVNGAVCGPIAYEVTLQHRTILAAVNMRTSLAVAGVWV